MDQMNWMKQIASYLTPQIGQSGPSYTGERVAPLSELQTQAMGLAGGLPGQVSAAQQAANQQLGLLASGQWAQPVYDWTSRLWSRDIMPSIMERQAGMDAAGSGGTTEALMRGGQDLASQLAAQLAPLTAQTGLASIPLMGDVSMWQSPVLQQLGLWGGLGQQQAQNVLTADIEKWKEQEPIYSPVWGQLPMLFGQQVENISKGQPAGMGYSALSSLGSIFGTEAGAGAALGLGGDIFGGAGSLIGALLGMI